MARYKDKLPQSQGGDVVFHDPCYLGRYQNIYEPPRELIALTANVVEPERNHERSFCCGAGGGLAFLGEEKGERISHARAKELAGTWRSDGWRSMPFLQYYAA